MLTALLIGYPVTQLYSSCPASLGLASALNLRGTANYLSLYESTL